MHLDSKTAEFGEHKLSAEQHARFLEESRISDEETGYRASVLNLWLLRIWRILDGSMFRAVWFRLVPPHFENGELH